MLGRLGLAARVWRLWELILTAANRKHDAVAADDGLPLPPVSLRVRVIAHGDTELFLATGKADAAMIAEACAEHGVAIEDVGRLLDFGCGCGRVCRHWAPFASSAEIHGVDHDADLTSWLATGVPFVRAQRTGLAPPLPYPDDHFGLVYAISVFTHMTEELSAAWMAELHRVLRGGGLLLFSVVGEENLDRLRPHERAAFDRGELVVQFEEGLGTNLCATYHPKAYLERLTRDFEHLGTRPIGAQRLWALRSRG
jgi:SAM-dependent methyltransferase